VPVHVSMMLTEMPLSAFDTERIFTVFTSDRVLTASAGTVWHEFFAPRQAFAAVPCGHA
jgi:hypothetical protein